MVFLLFVFQPKIFAQEIETLIPADDDISDWKMAGAPEMFEGDNLFELINGGADLYHEYGFVRVLSVHYADPALNNLQAEVYEMEDDQSAYGIFSLTRLSSEWSDQFGSLAAIEGSYVSFWKSRYFVTISFMSGQGINQQALFDFALAISGKIDSPGEYPALVEKFRDQGSDRKPVFLEGNIALTNFYYFDYRNIFRLKEAVAVSANGYHRIIINYPDTAASQTAITGARQDVSVLKRFSGLETTFQGFSCRDNKGNLVLARQVENYIVILVSLDPALQLAPVMDEIILKIEHGNL
jgi:hypothetical protein